MSGFQLKRLGVIMEPEIGNPNEVEGVLNPGVARGLDGQLYLFPRLVAKGNYSRIGIARVLFDPVGKPSGVERLGIALEPTADYEIGPHGGGCEDPRITFVEPMQIYVMTYTALSSIGPRIAIAVSHDLFQWERIGLATFAQYDGIDFVHVANKDSSIFPVAIPNHNGKLQLAIVHRPLFSGTFPIDGQHQFPISRADPDHESIWISYCPMLGEGHSPNHLGLFNSHHRLASPVSSWEKLKIGGGNPPVLTQHGWLLLYHGVSEVDAEDRTGRNLRYSAGVMVLSREHPRVILYRSVEPVLVPELPEEQQGMIANVVFPTGIDRRIDINQGDRYDVYYGMADNRIGVAQLQVPRQLPSGGHAKKST